MANERAEYIPGQCNIGPAETKQRVRAGWTGVILSVVLEFAFVVLRVHAPWRLLVFLPVSLAAAGFLQAAFHFCANFGMRGVFNFGEDTGRVESVMQQEFRKKDRAKAQQIIILSGVIGAAVALLAFFAAPR